MMRGPVEEDQFEGVRFGLGGYGHWPRIMGLVGFKLNNLEVNWNGNTTVSESEFYDLTVQLPWGGIRSLTAFVQGEPGNYDWSTAEMDSIDIEFKRDRLKELAGDGPYILQTRHILVDDNTGEIIVAPDLEPNRSDLNVRAFDGLNFVEGQTLPQTVEGDSIYGELDVTDLVNIEEFKLPEILGSRQDIERPPGKLYFGILAQIPNYTLTVYLRELVLDMLDADGNVMGQYAPPFGAFIPLHDRVSRVDWRSRFPGNYIKIKSTEISWTDGTPEVGTFRGSSGAAVEIDLEQWPGLASVRVASISYDSDFPSRLDYLAGTLYHINALPDYLSTWGMDPLEPGTVVNMPELPGALYVTADDTLLFDPRGVGENDDGDPLLDGVVDPWGADSRVMLEVPYADGFDLTRFRSAVSEYEKRVSVHGGRIEVQVPPGRGRVLGVFLEQRREVEGSGSMDFVMQFNIVLNGTVIATENVALEYGVPADWRWTWLSAGELLVDYDDGTVDIYGEIIAPPEIAAEATAGLSIGALLSPSVDLTVEEMRGVDDLGGGGGGGVDQEPQWMAYVNTTEAFETTEVDTRFQPLDYQSLDYLVRCDPTAEYVVTQLVAKSGGAVMAVPTGGMVPMITMFAPRTQDGWRGAGAPPDVDVLYSCNRQSTPWLVIPIYYGPDKTAERAVFSVEATDNNGNPIEHTVLGFFGKTVFVAVKSVSPPVDDPDDWGQVVYDYDTIVVRSDYGSFAICSLSLPIMMADDGPVN